MLFPRQMPQYMCTMTMYLYLPFHAIIIDMCDYNRTDPMDKSMGDIIHPRALLHFIISNQARKMCARSCVPVCAAQCYMDSMYTLGNLSRSMSYFNKI